MSGMQGAAPPPQQMGSAPAALPASHDEALAQHGQLDAQFKQMQKAQKALDGLRVELDKLTMMGASVTPDDVLESATRLIARGMDPMKMAGLLADMPQAGGDALASWVAQHDQMASVQEAQVAQAKTQVQHAAGVSALHAIASHDVTNAQAAPPAAPPNPLAAAPPQSIN